MSLNKEKREFLKKLSGGLHVLMTCSYKADDIAIEAMCPIEQFIRDNLITRNTSLTNASCYWFSEAKFDAMVDLMPDEELIGLLRYFDDIDMYMKRVYYEAQLPRRTLSSEDFKFALLIDNGELVNFEDFINY